MRQAILRKRTAVAVILALAVGVTSYALTASNTVPNSSAGAGSGTISGYTVSGIQYNLNATTPTNLDGVTFTISPAAAATVKIQLAAAGAWYNCTNSSGSVSCSTTSPQATVAGATQLTVVATG